MYVVLDNLYATTYFFVMFAKSKNRVTRAGRRYIVELGISMVAYVAAMAIRGNLLYGPHLGPISHANRSLLVVIALIPFLPTIAVFAVIVRYIRGTDERMYRIFVDSFAIAGGITALLSVGYGLLEGEFVPLPSAWMPWVAYWVAFGTILPILRRRY